MARAAEDQSAPSADGGVTADSRAIAEAYAAALANDAATAEQLLVRVNRAPVGTAAWHVETAQRLMQMAYDVPRQGRTTIGPEITARALRHLADAEPIARDAQERASVFALAGLIQERFVGDHAAAIASYRAAAQLNPEHPRARASADRLEQARAAVTAGKSRN